MVSIIIVYKPGWLLVIYSLIIIIIIIEILNTHTLYMIVDFMNFYYRRIIYSIRQTDLLYDHINFSNLLNLYAMHLLPLCCLRNKINIFYKIRFLKKKK